MSARLHAEIKRSKEQNGTLWMLMNARKGDFGLVNGQLVEYGRPVRNSNGEILTDSTRIKRFIPMRFHL